MRSIQTFILRLLVDTETPGALCGAVQGVAEDQARPFHNARALVALLNEIVWLPRQEPSEDQRAQTEEGLCRMNNDE